VRRDPVAEYFIDGDGVDDQLPIASALSCSRRGWGSHPRASKMPPGI